MVEYTDDPPALECTPPDGDLDFTAGTATLEITEGPGLGTHSLSLDPVSANGYDAEDGELRATFSDAAGHALTFDIEDLDACAPDPFVSIAANADQTFVDPSHTQCIVAVGGLDAAGIEGTFACTGLAGGGEGVTIDAFGSFSATA